MYSGTTNIHMCHITNKSFTCMEKVFTRCCVQIFDGMSVYVSKPVAFHKHHTQRLPGSACGPFSLGHTRAYDAGAYTSVKNCSLYTRTYHKRTCDPHPAVFHFRSGGHSRSARSVHQRCRGNSRRFDTPCIQVVSENRK